MPSATSAHVSPAALSVEDPASSKSMSDESVSFASLRKWNIGAFAMQFVTGVVIMFITDSEATVPMYTNFANDERGNPSLYAATQDKIANFELGYLSGVFLLLSAASHFVSAFTLRGSYEDSIAKGANPIRWIEYSVSASLMHVMIGMLSGVWDVHLNFAIFGLTATTMLFGMLQEYYTNRGEEASLLPFWLGCVPHTFGWLIICCYFFQGVSNGDPPAFVWAIIFIELVLDSTFALNMYLQQKKVGKWADYMYGEKVYIILSFTAKQFLAWLNYGGTKSLTNED